MDLPAKAALHRRSGRALPARVAIAAAFTAAAPATASAAAPTAQEVEFFEKRVRPVLAEECYRCHSHRAKKLKAGLHLDSREGLLRGGDSGPAIVPGDPAKSLLVTAISYADTDLQMPPKKKLADGAIADLTRWVEAGAPWPQENPPAANAPGAVEAFDLEKRKREQWSWQPLAKAPPPPVEQSSWPRADLDRFILAKLEAAGLQPAEEAGRRTWIRRVTYDLTGLPPTPREVADFLADKSEQAHEVVVDRLLGSPHFGERWARHWLDLVRYAETYGHEFDYTIPNAYRYRDYLVRAFNADVPYDQLIREHLAGDVLEKPRRNPEDGTNQSVIGTGFWFFGEATHAPVDVRGDEAGRVDNQLDVFSKTFLGLTVACARCHDHKFDPISTKDYYALAGFLQSSRRQEAMLDPGGKIAAAAAEFKQNRTVADRATAALAADEPRAGERFAHLLLAALDATDRGGDVARAAAHFRVPEEQLRRWVSALEDEAVKSPEHPLHAWHVLAAEDERDRSGSRFVGRREELAKKLAEQEARAAREEEASPLFEGFDDPGGGYGAWSTTGEAFGDGPTRQAQWGAAATGERAATPGVAHSGLDSRRLRGVLRSPTFTLEHARIHYRLKAEGVQIRLIIDGYFMDVYNGLLFKDVTQKNVKTDGKWAWRTQAGDIRKYLGHRAHIEIIDHGDGFAAVDEVRFGDGGPPARRPHPAVVWLAGEKAGLRSIRTLAGAYGELWETAAKRWREGDEDTRLSALAEWAINHGLAPLSGGEEADALAAELEAAGHRRAEIEGRTPAPQFVLAMADGPAEDERVHIRGNHRNLGPPVPRRLLEGLDVAGALPDHFAGLAGSGRLELAEQILDEANPFAPRVLVNRLWHHLFGRGIVATVDDFGVMGQPPTHPALLDHLARRVRAEHGWSVKAALREIVLSGTYRMSSRPHPATAEKAATADPENRLLHRMPVRRLQAEAIRDGILATSGRLDRKLFGPSVKVHLTPFMEGRGRPGSGPLDGAGRRSLYTEVRRNFLPPFLLTFDTPIPFSTMGRRSVSNVPAQALILMNDPFVVGQAQHWAGRLLQEAGSAEERIALAFEEAFARPPRPAETARLLTFLGDQAGLHGCGADDPKVWADLCHVLYNMKEFIYLR